MSMNTRTFTAWLRALGYTWTGQEQMLKGFMSQSDAQRYIDQLEAEGALKRG